MATTTSHRTSASTLELFWVALRLGLTSFGGPVAHMGYFHDEYVTRRRWVDERTFADLVALSQTLPGPASSKVGMSIGILRAGLPGGLVAWLGFTLPSAIVLVLFALFVGQLGAESSGWLHGLQVAAVSVVALAVWSMARMLTPDVPRALMAILAALVILVWPAQGLSVAFAQVVIIVLAALAGRAILPPAPGETHQHVHVPISARVAGAALVAWIALLLGLPVLRVLTSNDGVALFDSFFRVGSLVFGGGHVVLPLLQAEVVPRWVTSDQFLAGYGAAQAVPGPLFTFSAYLGAIVDGPPDGWLGAVIALVAIFMPSFLMVVGTLPSWGALRSRPGVQSALKGINAAVVGLLAAALYQSVWTVAILSVADVALAVAGFVLLAVARAPSWLVVLLAAAAGAGLSAAGIR